MLSPIKTEINWLNCTNWKAIVACNVENWIKMSNQQKWESIYLISFQICKNKLCVKNQLLKMNPKHQFSKESVFYL